MDIFILYDFYMTLYRLKSCFNKESVSALCNIYPKTLQKCMLCELAFTQRSRFCADLKLL